MGFVSATSGAEPVTASIAVRQVGDMGVGRMVVKVISGGSSPQEVAANNTAIVPLDSSEIIEYTGSGMPPQTNLYVTGYIQ